MNKPITVTFDKGAAVYVWQILKDSIKNKDCPFCGRRVKRDHFGGAFHYKDEARLVHSELPCLMELAECLNSAPPVSNVGGEQ